MRHLINSLCSLPQGADASPVDRWNGTPLDDAMRSGHAPVVAYLRAKGAEDGGTGVVAPSPAASCNGGGRSGRGEIPREQSNGAPAMRRMSEGKAVSQTRRMASKDVTIRSHLCI